MDDNDETKLIRTLAPDELPSDPQMPTFDWRINVAETLRALIERKVLNALSSNLELAATPAIVIVIRSNTSGIDRIVQADIMDSDARRLGTVRITDNGAGKVYFARGG